MPQAFHCFLLYIICLTPNSNSVEYAVILCNFILTQCLQFK